jgi:hypothetical protein
LRQYLLADVPWSVLGQSFGGFCALTYLSFAPDGLREVFISGGLPPLAAQIDDIYRMAYRRVLKKNEQYFSRYPGDEVIVRQIVDHLGNSETFLPTGERLTSRRFLTLGIGLGSAATFDRLHYLLEESFLARVDDFELSDAFLAEVQRLVSYAEQPLYALLHEAIYCQGSASRWSAERVLAEFQEFDAGRSGSVRFFGEMIYPWLFDEDSALVPLRDAAHSLASISDWPALYDTNQLAANSVPVVAAIYHNDMFVDFGQSLITAGMVRGLRTWITNEFDHDAVRTHDSLLDGLIAMARGLK